MYINTKTSFSSIKIHIYLQARINSTRFPGKVLKKICGKSVIELLLERLSNVKNVDKIILLTGSVKKNRLLVEEAKKLNLQYFCGNEENILDRFYNAAKEFSSDIIIRITADCPLIDYNLINKGIDIFLKKDCDILSVNRNRTYPHGLDFEIFKSSSLEKAWEENLKKIGNKEEFFSTFIPPTKYMLTEKIFINYDLVNKKNFSHIRLTLDYPEDFELITKIFESLYHNNKRFRFEEILDLLKVHPELLNINKMHTKLNNEMNIEL